MENTYFKSQDFILDIFFPQRHFYVLFFGSQQLLISYSVFQTIMRQLLYLLSSPLESIFIFLKNAGFFFQYWHMPIFHNMLSQETKRKKN